MAVVAITLSDPLKADLIVYRGDSGQFRITLSDDDGPIDVSDAVWSGQIKHKADDTSEITLFDIEPVIADTSSVDVKLTAEHSALINKNCFYDIEMTRGIQVVTLMSGEIIITKDVTRP